MTGFEPRPSGLEMTALPTEPQPQIFTQTHELCQCLKVFLYFLLARPSQDVFLLSSPHAMDESCR